MPQEGDASYAIVQRVRRMRRFCGMWMLVLAVAAVLAAPVANAGLLGTGSASYCDPSASKPFAAWGDSANYVLTPGGDFEQGSTPWALSGGARIVSGNEPYYVGGRGDTRSLLLPTGSSANTATMCFALGDWHLRLFARNVGSKTGGLKVTVIVPSLLGILTVLDGGTISGDGSWRPSPRLQLLLCNVTSLVGTRAVAFRFTPVGTGAAYQIDDVYLDPWKGT
jgi:hypothetical protein